MRERTALLIGASGLVGGNCLDYLLADDYYTKIITPVRSLLPVEHSKLIQHQVDFDKPEDLREVLKGDDVFCCLGTTIRKAGSKAAFNIVDLVYPLRVAKLALLNGAEQFLLISAMGADPQSSIFYNRVKGEVEQAIENCGYPALNIFRPSLLIGERPEKRAGEDIGKWLFRFLPFIFIGPLARYKPVAARAVAYAMVEVAKGKRLGKHVIESTMISSLFRQSEPKR